MDLERSIHESVTEAEVIWAYRILLGRDPESKAIIEESQTLRSLDALRKRIMRSAEFRNTLRGEGDQVGSYAFLSDENLRADLVWHSRLTLAEIDLTYKAILGRDLTDADVAGEHLARNENLFSLVTELLSSDENIDNYRKRSLLESFRYRISSERTHVSGANVMLFGAFGNGNVGDQCQADAIRRLIEKSAEAPEQINITASSWENVNPYFLDIQAPTGRDEILNPDRLSSSKLLLIGGGGLLSTPHFPLYNETWVDGLKKIGCKYALIGVGATITELTAPGRAEGYRKLLAGALFVTGRDSESINALSAFRADTRFMPDPFFATASDIDILHAPKSGQAKIILIPKYPVNANEKQGLAALIALQANLNERGVETVTLLFEPHMDRKIAGSFNNVIEVNSWRDALANVADANAVVTMRFHGALFALASKVSVLCISIPKIRDLYLTLGLERFIVDTESVTLDREFNFNDDDWERVNNYFITARAAAAEVKERIVEALASDQLRATKAISS